MWSTISKIPFIWRTVVLSPPKFETLSTLADREFAAAAPHLRNISPETIRNTYDFTKFKQMVKTFLFKQAYCKKL